MAIYLEKCGKNENIIIARENEKKEMKKHINSSICFLCFYYYYIIVECMS